MLDGITLDQLRTFIAAVDEGSFSAAGRRLNRAQSVVSQTLANLEAQLDLALFVRTGNKPVLTDKGKALIAQARAVASSMDLFKAHARGLSAGLEAELSIVVDVMYPIERLTLNVVAFRSKFPNTPLRVHVEALGAVLEPVIDRRCGFGIMGSLPEVPDNIAHERLSHEEMAMVAAPLHPLATFRGLIPLDLLAQHIQLVLTDRSKLSDGKQFGVISPKIWYLADLGAKYSFLRAGLGWGSMPLHIIQADLDAGTLVRLTGENLPIVYMMEMLAVYRSDTLPGPAARWLINRLKAHSRQSDNN